MIIVLLKYLVETLKKDNFKKKIFAIKSTNDFLF